jgi:hypothetical protein
MGSTPQTVNGVLQTVDAIMHAAIYDVALNAAFSALVAQVPFFGFPIVSIITKYLMSWMTGYFYDPLSKIVDNMIIDGQVSAEQKAVQQATTQLKQAQASGDADALAKAKAAFKQSLGNLIHSDGS